MARFLTPLRYPGGKAKLSGLIKQIFRLNSFNGGHYAEPYAGGAGVALELLLCGYASHVHLNDLNYPVYCFWRSVQREADCFCERINRAKLDINTWKSQKSIIQNPRAHSQLDVAFAFFYLNRTNRSGIISAGVIGGIDQTGPWKMDARFPKADLIERIERLALYKGNISITNMDAIKFLARCSEKLPKQSFIYLDPPYFKQGQRLYDNFYKPEDHAQIAKEVARLKHPWLVSYDDVYQVRALYEKFRQSAHELNYSAATAYKGKEALIFSQSLQIPDTLTVGIFNAVA